ncbi:MAG: COX15/CtaA family protein [Bacteroidota bacterium]|nr:COX15/CtaA family protein [Cytophagales bacterium]
MSQAKPQRTTLAPVQADHQGNTRVVFIDWYKPLSIAHVYNVHFELTCSRMGLVSTRGFYKLCLTTLVAVYFLIAVGGIVRATGSGMGCPDWPKCFGNLVPPTSIEQLPPDYKESYSALREKKNVKFAKYLQVIGMTDTANKILNDQSILVEADFNAVKTWIEYLNRLVGVVIGLLIVALFFQSLKFIKVKPILFWLSLATLLAVIVQGWFGSIVVSTNLTTWTITIHMFVAMMIVGFLVYLLFASNGKAPVEVTEKGIRGFLVVCMGLLLLQIYFGTQVREAIDKVVSLPRNAWIENLGLAFIVHRSFSWIILIFNGILIWKLMKSTELKALSIVVILLILASFFTGVVMAYFSVPAAFQPIHLLLATVTFGVQLYLFFSITKAKQPVLVQ